MKMIIFMMALLVSGMASANPQTLEIRGHFVSCYLCQKSDFEEAENSSLLKAMQTCKAQDKKLKVLNTRTSNEIRLKTESIRITGITKFQCI